MAGAVRGCCDPADEGDLFILSKPPEQEREKNDKILFSLHGIEVNRWDRICTTHHLCSTYDIINPNHRPNTSLDSTVPYLAA
jgi:hypothetical protein